MTCRAYYNEFDPYAAQWLRNLIAAGHIAPGDVDERSITDVAPDDLAGYRQCHFFAGIAGWSLAARLAGWPDDRELWTGSAPCQPFSVAGAQRGTDDERHLWPHLFRLASSRRPSVLMGEQVAAAVGKDWLDGIAADLERIGYACGATVVPACAVDSPHRRDRLWFVADAMREGSHAGAFVGLHLGQEGAGARDVCATRLRGARSGGDVADGQKLQRNGGQHNAASGSYRSDKTAEPRIGHWSNVAWIIGHDGKARRVGSDVRRVVDGLPCSLAGMCASFYAEAAEEVISYATTAKCGPDEVLRTVRDIVAAEAVWQKPGGFHGVREAEILLPYLRELERRIDKVRLPGAVQKNAQSGVRGVRVSARAACASQGRGLHEQRAGEYPDALHSLSRFLACAARQAADPLLRDARPMGLLANGIEARVGKLRALGNAIVPQVAAEVIAAYMECRP